MQSRLATLLTLALAWGFGLAHVSGETYERSQQLKDGVTIRWTIKDPEIKLALEVKASGWVGFGLPEVGGMKGSDIVYYERGSNKLVDAFATDNAKPETDCGSQDWTLVASSFTDGVLKVEMSRKLVTGDSLDRSFTDDSGILYPTPVIMAWGDDAEITYHAGRRVKGVVRFFQKTDSEADQQQKLIEGANSSTFLMDYEIPARVTTYEEECFSLDSIGSDAVPLHAIAFEPIIAAETAKHVHHYVLYGLPSCDSSIDEGLIVWLWAPGQLPKTFLPPEAGIRLMTSQGFKGLRLQVHYDNPATVSGLVDKSGFKMYHTRNLRANDAGVLQLGDPAIFMSKKPVRAGTQDGYSKIVLENKAETCTDMFDVEQVTVFDRFLHMHSTGRSMETRHYRGNELIRTDKVEYYDFIQAGAYPPRSTGSGFKIKKGDRFEVSCFYYSSQATVFGKGSEDEMCIDFVYYYPRQKNPPIGMCLPTNVEETTPLSSPTLLNREFGRSGCTAGSGTRTVSAAVWTTFIMSAACLLVSLSHSK